MPGSPPQLTPPARRRKIRRGTQSCWECKRRKIRCTFASPAEPICDGCRSRHTRCVSQAFYDEPAHRLLATSGRSRGDEGVHRVGEEEEEQEEEEEEAAAVAKKKKGKKKQQQQQPGQQPGQQPEPEPVRDDVLRALLLVSAGDPHEISSALLAVWPSDDDLDWILRTSTPAALSGLFHGLVCLPYADFLSRQMTSPRRMLQRPPRGTHPVLVARRLLMLGTLLQGIRPSSSSGTRPTGPEHRSTRLMSRAVAMASRLVTTSDELAGGSLEGIECVMAESMFLNNAGELRRAWLAARRAMALAQAIGLHRYARHGGSGGRSSSPLVVLDPETWDRIDPEYMWCRLIFSDRYLSLMLGLPPGCSEDHDGDDSTSSFASPEALTRCAPLERMERMMAVAGGLILRRNGALRRRGADLAATREIDGMLREAAALMSPKWWLAAATGSKITTTAKSGNGYADEEEEEEEEEKEAFEDSLRVVNQFTHRHLLLQLHLPYLLLSPSRPAGAGAADAAGGGASSVDYSKMTAAATSRELVSQFVSFRSSSSGGGGGSNTAAYCRGIDFIAFIASTTLCLAHIEARRLPQGTGTGVFQSLQHQRQSDRGLLERALDIIETAAQRDRDAIAQRIARILRPLLDIEDNSAKGLCSYETTTSAPEDSRAHEAQPAGGVAAADDDAEHAPCSGVLRIHIPYFGTISVEHRPSGGGDGCAPPVGISPSESPHAADIDLAAILREPVPSPAIGCVSSSNIQSVESPDWHVLLSPSWFHPTAAASASEPGPSSLDVTASHAQGYPCLFVPGPTADVVDDWALQGVDMALFGNLIQGGSTGDPRTTRSQAGETQ